MSTMTMNMDRQKLQGFQGRTIFIAIITTVLIGAVVMGIFQTLEPSASKVTTKATLGNVRDYATAPTTESMNYAVDGGTLFYGNEAGWTELSTPDGVIINAVAVDSSNPEILYIGAANELTMYRSMDAGKRWVAVPLSDAYIGAVTDIAVDSFQRLVYVGTDNAGLFRLRDTGPTLTLSSHLLLNEPVIEVATDSTGSGLAFARTEWDLYRTGNFGMSWTRIEGLSAIPTALVVANTEPATVYLGTADRGILKSYDGLSWSIENQGFNTSPASRFVVDALAVDPTQPNVLYAATSHLFGSTTLNQTAAGIFMSLDSGDWTMVSSADEFANANIAELLPISGEAGAFYALTDQSRTPVALGNAPAYISESLTVVDSATPSTSVWGVSLVFAWILAGLAFMALLFTGFIDIKKLQKREVATSIGSGTLEPSIVQSDG